MIQTGLSNAVHRDDLAVAHTTRTRQSIFTGSTLSLYGTLEIIYRLTHVKALPSLVAIKGEAGHPSEDKAQV